MRFKAPPCNALFRLIFAWLTCACALASPAGAAPPEPLTVQDGSGTAITLTHPAHRIVSLAPHTTELLFAVDAGPEVRAVSDFSDYPEAARHLPSVGGAQGVDLERIAALKPDLVVAWTSGNNARQLDALRALGIPVYRSDPHTPEAIASDLEALGILTGHAARGAEEARRLRTGLAALAAQAAQPGRRPVRVFYQVWDRPLMTLGPQHLVSQILALCGGQTIFPDVKGLTALVDRETVLARDPEAIFSAGTPDGTPLAAWRAWPGLAAVRDHALFVIDPGIVERGSPRILEGARAVCADLDRVRRVPSPVPPTR